MIISVMRAMLSNIAAAATTAAAAAESAAAASTAAAAAAIIYNTSLKLKYTGQILTQK